MMMKPRELLKIDVHEVSLVDAAANLRTFAIVKRRHREAQVAKFVVQLALTKDKAKIKALSKELALERLAQAAGVIETMKANMDQYESMEDLWKAMDEVHSLLWGAEGDIVTAVLKKSLTADQTSAVADVAELAPIVITDEDVTKHLMEAITSLKAKAVTPARLAALSDIAAKLTDAIEEMAPPQPDQPAVDLAAEVTKALAPLKQDVDGLKAELAVQKAEVVAQKAVTAEATAKLSEANAKVAELQKQLDNLAANTATPAQPDTPTVPATVTKSIWAGSPFSRS